jgi:hypothetical protein
MSRDDAGRGYFVTPGQQSHLLWYGVSHVKHP